MRNRILVLIAALAIAATAQAANPIQQASRCAEQDKVCRQFESLTEAQQFEKIIELYDANRRYSEESRGFIGDACLALASRDNLSAEQEESYYRKALEVKHVIAYMGLYFLYAQKDEGKALGFLREYAKTKPADAVPYAILGESELYRKNYGLADTYLRRAKNVAHAHSPRIDWLLFQANYLLKDYRFAMEMFESAVTKGNFENELKIISLDPRFEGVDKRPEFAKFRHMLNIGQDSSERRHE